MSTPASVSFAVVPMATNIILVAHSSAPLAAGLLSTMQRLYGPTDAPSSRALAPPRIVMLTATARSSGGTTSLPPEISLSSPMSCKPDELLMTLCGLINSGLPVERPARVAADQARGEPASAARPRGGIAPSALRRVREHIEAHLDGRIDVSQLATLTGLSACHFSRAFKQSVGVPPHRYVTSRRIVAAAKMIESTDKPMSEIALDLGFSDQSHFTRVFTAHTGESPRRFRHRLR